MRYISFFATRLRSLLFINTCVLAVSTTPQTAQWSSNSYGPDGPWQAITVSIGTPPQTIDLLPGGSWMTNVLAPSVCANGVACPIAKQAGFYTADSSNTSFEIGQTGDVNSAPFAATVGAISSLTGNANWTFDTMSIPMLNGVAGNIYRAIVPDFDLFLITSAHETLPDGTTYPAQIGKLSLGAPNFNQTWLHFPPNPNWNGTLLPSALFEQGLSPSNSFGMHIGSAAKGIPGSLNFGGFDQSRVIGPVSSQVYSIDHLPIDLLDIGIGVAEGTSPFNFTSQAGLLTQGNSSIGLSTSVLVEAPTPYIYLPQSTCDAITQHLPVTYEPKYGLYFWNTADPNYKPIVSSPAFLSFSFRLSGSVSQNMTINVPFSLLNLTLTAPITTTATQYLPLRRGQGPSGSYELGRAFLQAAFIGVNWQAADNDGNGVWFLAQAPGPNTPTQNPATGIGAKDNSIVGSTSVWKDTWTGAWTVLGSTNTSTGGTTTTTPSKSSTAASKTGLSTGATAGIAVGITIPALAAMAAAFFFYKRHRAAKNKSQGSSERETSQTTGTGRYDQAEVGTDPGFRGSYKTSGYGPRELEGGNYTIPPPNNFEPRQSETAHDVSRPVEMAG
ncbi:hypothetical protein EG329_014079 [Mollisiaceae sp. DMI_Dod_QoI]|nr:hypothetical protein EG329_014079 [Helotiales sp. DMI_Dod_QoI]